MNAVKKPSVLVCVTRQYDCDRLIEAGFEKAAEEGLALHVFCVHTPTNDLTNFSVELEYLYRTAKDLDMRTDFFGFRQYSQLRMFQDIFLSNFRMP